MQSLDRQKLCRYTGENKTGKTLIRQRKQFRNVDVIFFIRNWNINNYDFGSVVILSLLTDQYIIVIFLNQPLQDVGKKMRAELFQSNFLDRSVAELKELWKSCCKNFYDCFRCVLQGLYRIVKLWSQKAWVFPQNSIRVFSQNTRF